VRWAFPYIRWGGLRFYDRPRDQGHCWPYLRLLVNPAQQASKLLAGAECAAARIGQNHPLQGAARRPPPRLGFFAALGGWSFDSGGRCRSPGRPLAKGLLPVQRTGSGSGQPHPGRAPSELRFANGDGTERLPGPRLYHRGH